MMLPPIAIRSAGTASWSTTGWLATGLRDQGAGQATCSGTTLSGWLGIEGAGCQQCSAGGPDCADASARRGLPLKNKAPQMIDSGIGEGGRPIRGRQVPEQFGEVFERLCAVPPGEVGTGGRVFQAAEQVVEQGREHTVETGLVE